MKAFLVMVIASLFIVSCKPDKTAIKEKKPENFIVLLDLSDRLLNENQAARDIELVKHLFDKYESVVRNNLIINSKDRFRIVIAPQENMNLNTTQYEDELYLDMSNKGIADKRIRLEEFKTSLNSKLGKLYGEVTENRKKASDYQGAHLWKYFNDYLAGDIEKNGVNRLFILTDGYFDFEAASARKTIGNRTTTSDFLNTVRGKAKWKEMIEKKDYGIIPTGQTFDSLSVCILEISPKYSNLDETQMLQYIWERWLMEMKVKNVSLIPHSGLRKIEGQINGFITER